MRQSHPDRVSPPDNRDKRYGWYRVYEDFPGHPKWQLIATRTGVPIAFVEAIVQRMFAAASKARADGYLGGFDIELCAISAGAKPEDVISVYRALEGMGFVREHVIVDWNDRNPRDKTSADRQRNKRARDDAKRAILAGNASNEQLDMMSASEREALNRLAALSRVTPAPVTAAPLDIITPFVPVRPKSDVFPDIEAARIENDALAREWLIGGKMTPYPGYGIASRIVADNFGCTRLNADTTIRRWLRDEMAGDALALALIISGADEQALNGDHFRNVVEQRLAAYVREQTAGPALPLGPQAITGGRGR